MPHLSVPMLIVVFRFLQIAARLSVESLSLHLLTTWVYDGVSDIPVSGELVDFLYDLLCVFMSTLHTSMKLQGAVKHKTGWRQLG